MRVVPAFGDSGLSQAQTSHRVLESRKLEMSIILAVTTRVRLRSDLDVGPGPWPGEPLGTIAAYPTDGAPFTWVDTGSGRERQYWVVFDSPQCDAEVTVHKWPAKCSRATSNP
jgi:hypothetical protein